MKKGTLLTITGLLAIGTAFCVNIALAQAPSILGDNTGTLGGVVDISPPDLAGRHGLRGDAPIHTLPVMFSLRSYEASTKC